MSAPFFALGVLLAGLGEAFLAGVAFGALPGNFAGLVAVPSGIVLTIGVVVSGPLRAIGFAGVGLGALLFIPVGLPASGGPLGARFVLEWYAWVAGFSLWDRGRKRCGTSSTSVAPRSPCRSRSSPAGPCSASSLLVLLARRPSAEPEAPRHPVTASGI
ncbi:hypothetical protein AB0M95_29110 [Sphaerisporangium sp. NPDC051017]|uniref:hypothetical protein n=1 Tax=Sphaerisporangium sp. NPDC051017 TaxID=3154636 RepID=UPI003419B708